MQFPSGTEWQEAPPPSFSEFGQQADAIVGNGHHIGVKRVYIGTRLSKDLQFNICTSRYDENKRLTTGMDLKYMVPDYGLSFLQYMDTDGIFQTTVTNIDTLAKDLKLDALATYTMNAGKKYDQHKYFRLKAAYTRNAFRMDARAKTIHQQGLKLSASLVIGLVDGWSTGWQTTFCTYNKPVQHDFTIGYAAPDFAVHTSFNNNGDEMVGSVFRKIYSNLAVAARFSSTSTATNFNVGFTVTLPGFGEKIVRAQMDNFGKLSVGYQQSLFKDTMLVLTASANCLTRAQKVGIFVQLNTSLLNSLY